MAFLASATLALGLATRASAQGVTTGAVRGRILDTSGQPIVGASVTLTNRNSGARFLGTSGTNGGFFIANVVIGPYLIEARAIGFRPAGRTPISVTLGQVTEEELRLEPSTIELAEITSVGAQDNALLAPSRTGPVAFVDSNLLRDLPSLNRNFIDFTRTNSLVNGGSIAGQSDRFNQLQIDGGSNGDLFGLNASGGQPGGRNNSRPLSVEAIQEVQVLIAPYDVRQGGFTGGLINAVTKSGTNEFHGSAFFSYQNQRLTGPDSLGFKANQFYTSYYGFSFGGPIIRDRLHFFFAGEKRQNEQPLGGNTIIGSDTTNGADSVNVGIRATTAERVRAHSDSAFGFNPGAFGRPNIPNPDLNYFAKLTAQLGSRSQAELSYNHVKSDILVLVHSPTAPSLTNIRDGYQYDNSGYQNDSHTNSLRFRLNTPVGNRLTNEMIASYNYISDVRQMGSTAPVVVIGADRRNTAPTASCTLGVPDSTGHALAPVTTGCPTTFLAIGGERFSHANILNQKIFEFTDNVTIDMGPHVFTVGGRAERFQFLNVFFPEKLGAWSFADTTAFMNGTPSRYEIALPAYAIDSVNGRRDGPIADFVFSQFGLYAQDQFHASRAWTFTLGARVDLTSLPQPAYNIRMDTTNVTVGPRAGQDFGVRTDTRVTNATLISPRFGFNYDPNGDRTTVFRGGVGVFTGRTPYVWASNAYTNTGLEQVQLICDGLLTTSGLADTVFNGPNKTGGIKYITPRDSVPAFTMDPNAQPTHCGGGASTAGLTAAVPSIVYFDKNFRLPQNLRASIGLDHRLPWGIIGSFDALYSRAINQFILDDVNLVPGGTSFGEGNRALYGTISTTNSTATPRRATTAARDVIRQYNSNRDYSYSLTWQFNKHFSNDLEFTASYTFSHAYDLISGTSDISNSLLRFAILDGAGTDPLANRNLRKSLWDVPHSIRVSGTTTLPYGVRFSLFYTGQSGRPYSYTSSSDLNADGLAGNDLIYVPLNAQDIELANPAQYAQLDAFINNDPCLRNSRGRVIERTACRNPWRSFLDARAVKSFNTVRGQSVEVTVSVFNVLSMLGIGGKIYSAGSNENVNLLSLSKYNTATGRGVYNLALPNNGNRTSQDVFSSRWKMELGARYIF